MFCYIVFQCMACGYLYFPQQSLLSTFISWFVLSLPLTMVNLVINISNIEFSPSKSAFSQRALTFAAHKENPDLLSLHRRLRLQSYFKDEEDSSPSDRGNFYSSKEFKLYKFREASTFNPPDPAALESMILLNEHDFNNQDMFTASGWNNLTVV